MRNIPPTIEAREKALFRAVCDIQPDAAPAVKRLTDLLGSELSDIIERHEARRQRGWTMAPSETRHIDTLVYNMALDGLSMDEARERLTRLGIDVDDLDWLWRALRRKAQADTDEARKKQIQKLLFTKKMTDAAIADEMNMPTRSVQRIISTLRRPDK